MSYRVPSGPLGLLALLAGACRSSARRLRSCSASMAGFWIGPGRIEFDAGTSEALLCKAYYTTADQTNRLSIVLRCASPSQKIELRAQLVAQRIQFDGNLGGTDFQRQRNRHRPSDGSAR